MPRNLTDEELAQSKIGPQFADVTPAQLFSNKADSRLSMRVRVENPAKYRSLKMEWEYLTGMKKRPDSYYL